MSAPDQIPQAAAAKSGGLGFDPFSLGLGALSGLSNMLTGGAQRRQQQKMFDAQRNDAQRAQAQQDAQFRANLGFQRDQDQYSRAQDQYNVGRQEEQDAYRRANTNALAPARQQLLGSLMARLLGGGVDPRQMAAGNAQASPAGQAALAQQWAQQFASQPAVTQRADPAALAAAASKPYTEVANPAAMEQQQKTSQAEQEARQRAEQMTQTYLQSKARDIASGKFSLDRYAQQLGFDPRDPANHDKWVQAFMDDDPAYRDLKNQIAAQGARTGAGMGAY